MLLILLGAGIPAMAQPETVEMADVMRSNGNIYVVVGIILIVLIGFFVYLISLDRKIRRIERRMNDQP
jgi:hypothetical protein